MERAMHDEQIIRSMFEQFTDAWATGKTEVLDDLLTEDCDIDFSIFDRDISRNDFKKQLAYRPVKPDYTRFEMTNFICCVGEETAQQSGVISGVFVKENRSFAFCAFMVNSLVLKENTWKYSAMRLDLGSGSDKHVRLYSTGVGVDYNIGDWSFVSHWHNIEDSVGWHEESRLLRIIPETDAPWYAVKNRLNTDHSDEDQIRETVNRYCFALDHDALELYNDVFTEDAEAVYSDDRIYNKRGVIAMLRHERQGMIGTGHILICDTFDLQGDVAYVHLYRNGMAYIPPTFYYGENAKKNYACARYDLVMKKENGMWKIHRLKYYPGLVELPYSPEIHYCVVEQ